MEQGRSLEKSKSNEAIAILSPKHINNVCQVAQPGGVEVRKVETTDIHYTKTGRSSVDQQHSVPLNTTSSRNSVHQQNSTFGNDQFINQMLQNNNSGDQLPELGLVDDLGMDTTDIKESIFYEILFKLNT